MAVKKSIDTRFGVPFDYHKVSQFQIYNGSTYNDKRIVYFINSYITDAARIENREHIQEMVELNLCDSENETLNEQVKSLLDKFMQDVYTLVVENNEKYKGGEKA